MATPAYVEANGVRFHCLEAGSGPPLLLVPGGGGWLATFRDLASELSKQYRVFAVDPPGQGLTEMHDPYFRYGADGITYALADFLDTVEVPRAAVVGHSWGGGFAVRLAELCPERVTGLALLAPGGIDVKDVWEFRLIRIPVVGDLAMLSMLFMSKAVARHMSRKSYAHRDRIPGDLIDEQIRMIRSAPARAALARTMLRVERSVRWTQTERALPTVKAPVLLLWGSEDRYFPIRFMDRFTARLPDVEAHALHGCGHSIHDDCPERAYPLLDAFLERVTT